MLYLGTDLHIPRSKINKNHQIHWCWCSDNTASLTDNQLISVELTPFPPFQIYLCILIVFLSSLYTANDPIFVMLLLRSPFLTFYRLSHSFFSQLGNFLHNLSQGYSPGPWFLGYRQLNLGLQGRLLGDYRVGLACCIEGTFEKRIVVSSNCFFVFVVCVCMPWSLCLILFLIGFIQGVC